MGMSKFPWECLTRVRNFPAKEIDIVSTEKAPDWMNRQQKQKENVEVEKDIIETKTIDNKISRKLIID